MKNIMIRELKGKIHILPWTGVEDSIVDRGQGVLLQTVQDLLLACQNREIMDMHDQCASEVYGSVFVCLCVCRLLQLLKDQ